jgi:hypothetical protein
MKVKIEVNFRDEETGVVSSATKRVEGKMHEVIRAVCVEAGFSLYKLNEAKNKGALVLCALFSPEFAYNNENKANYTCLTRKQFASLSRADLEEEIKTLYSDCKSLQSELYNLHSLINQRVIE